ncbi:MAG: hypothetical protein GQ564_07890 [Bacteroidales bacterium]|nr:hypothetical protein [Bacteroidales bacterium]
MKSKKLKMKLNVKKETIAKLNTNELNVVKGGETDEEIPSIKCPTEYSMGIC